MRLLVLFLSGALFGLGLALSDMIDPARVRAFLDVAGGAWDPTLGFVMAGALIPMAVAWRLAARRERPAFGTDFPGAPGGAIDRKLIAGAALFGLGWGMVGFCPGPALAALALGGWPVLLFIAAMLAGMALQRLMAQRASRPAPTG